MAFELNARPEGESKGFAPQRDELLLQLVLSAMRQLTCKRARVRHMSEGALQIGALCEQLLSEAGSKPAPMEQLAADLERLGQGRASACAHRLRGLAACQREASFRGGDVIA